MQLLKQLSIASVIRMIQFIINLLTLNQSMIDKQCFTETVKEEGDIIEDLNPQVRIYNRNFYLRNARIQQLQEQAAKQIQQLASKPKLTTNSYAILVQKIENKLNELYSKYLGEQDQIDFQKFQNIFTEITKIQNVGRQQEFFQRELISTQLWLLLVSYDLEVRFINKNKVTSIFHVLFCPYPLKPQEITALIDHAFPKIEQNRLRYLGQYPQAKDETLNVDNLVKLWLKIKRSHLSTINQQKNNAKQEYRPTFKPQINHKSRQYADNSLRKYLTNNLSENANNSKLNQLSGYISGGKELSYHQILYKRGLQKEKIRKKSMEMNVGNEKQKTLNIQQTKKLIENLYIIKERKQDFDFSKFKEQQELKLCTFHPSTIQYHKNDKAPQIKNYSKEIGRFEKARKDKLKLRQAYDNIGKVKSNICQQPPSMVERDKPRLILEIKVGQRIVQLKLKGDQEPKLVAKKFVVKHGLQESMQQVLQSVIEEQLASL